MVVSPSPLSPGAKPPRSSEGATKEGLTEVRMISIQTKIISEDQDLLEVSEEYLDKLMDSVRKDLKAHIEFYSRPENAHLTKRKGDE